MTSHASRFTSLTAKSGHPAGLFDGVSLCSRFDPIREAQRIGENRDKNAGAALFMGIGMAYHIEAYLQMTRDIPLIIVEKEEELFQQVVKIRSLDKLLNSQRVFLFINADPEELTPFLMERQLSRIEIIPHGSLCARDRDYYNRVTSVVHRWLDRREINLNTLNRFGRLWVRNLAANLPLLSRARPLSDLKGRFSGMAALLVAAGPSLESLLPHIKELSQRLVIIAVDTSYRNLAAHGVDADFLVVTDPQYWNTRHLDFCDISPSILITDSSTHPRALRDYPGPLFMSRSPFPLAGFFEDGFLDISLKSGGSVATAAWDLAFVLGCTSLFCAGLDLGFPGKQTHCRGSFFEERVNYLSLRTAGPEQWSWQALHSAPLSITEDYRGMPILTDQRMSVYAAWFKEQMVLRPDSTFNLSPRGAAISGLEHRSWKELKRFPRIRQTIEEIKKTLSKKQGNDKKMEMKDRLESLILSLDKALVPVKKALVITRELKKAFAKGEELEEMLTELEKLDEQIVLEGAKEIGGFLIQPHLKKIEEDSPGTGEEIIENSLKLYSQLSRSLQFHRDIFEDYSRWAEKTYSPSDPSS